MNGLSAHVAAAAMLAQSARSQKHDTQPPDPCENDAAFVRRYKLTIDRRPIDLDDAYKHLAEPYEDDHPDQVYMAGAQTGKSARLMVMLLRMGIKHWGNLFGYYFPDFHLPRTFSAQRFAPFVRASAELGRWLGTSQAINGTTSKGTEQVFTRTFGASTFFFLSTKGRSTTEGLPMKGVFFDEVRRMSAGDLQRAEERTSAQTGALNIKVSTAFYPNTDIHSAFLKGDQRYFHSHCKCPDGCVLSLTFPNCLADLKNAQPELVAKVAHAYTRAGIPYLGMTDTERKKYGDAAYVCPKCGEIIVDPRDGWWEAHNPGAWVHSYQMPQLLSPTFNAARCLQKYHRPTEVVDLQEIWNSMVGLPYIDANARPVTIEHLRSCVDESLPWAARQTEAWRRKHLKNTAMGIDVMGGFNCVVIKQMAPSGKYRTIHIEVCHGDDPWKRCAQLMVEYDVRVCVADAAPHYNESLRFAHAFLGRVWLAIYTAGNAPMVDWKDRIKSPKGQSRAGEDVKFKFMVNINRTRGLQWSLKRWERRLNETPDPATLIQRLPRMNGKVVLTAGLKVGTFEPVPICRDVYWRHLMCVAFRKVYPTDDTGQQNKQGKFVMLAEHVEIDPHLAHSSVYVDVALSRIGRPAHPKRVGATDPEP